MVPWEDALTGYATYLTARGVSPQTRRLRMKYLRRLSRVVPEPWSATADDLLGFLSEPSWSPETRKSARSSVRGFYAWAAAAGHIAADPARDLPSVRIPSALPRPAPRTVVTLAVADSDQRLRLMILLALLAGLRRAEIAAVHSDDIAADESGPLLRVRGKGGRVRLVPLHPQLAALIGSQPDGWLFPGPNGHLSANHVGTLLSRCLGPGWTAHTLRHRFATDAYAADRDLRAVQMLLGHSRPETTARYTQVADAALRSAVMSLRDVP